MLLFTVCIVVVAESPMHGLGAILVGIGWPQNKLFLTSAVCKPGAVLMYMRTEEHRYKLANLSKHSSSHFAMTYMLASKL